jgi:hypothetical protein
MLNDPMGAAATKPRYVIADWVEKNNVWSYVDSIKSYGQANAAGYTNYADNGSTVTGTIAGQGGVGTVLLGDNGVATYVTKYAAGSTGLSSSGTSDLNVGSDYPTDLPTTDLTSNGADSNQGGETQDYGFFGLENNPHLDFSLMPTVAQDNADALQLATIPLSEIGGELIGPAIDFIGGLFKAAPEVGDATSQLLTRASQKAESAIGGTGRFAGIAKHTYAINLLGRYQSIYGDLGLEFNDFFNQAGQRGFLDVVNHNTMTIYDFKFGSAIMSNAQYLKYSGSFPGYVIKIIRP